MYNREPSANATNAHSLLTEKMVAKFLSAPFMRENIFHSAKYIDNDIEKEVCDVLLVHRHESIVLSIKAQDKNRDELKTKSWLKKQTPKAISQIIGACRTFRDKNYWCDHDLLGRRSFHPGQIIPKHGIVVLDSNIECAVELEVDLFNQQNRTLPVTLINVKDLLYITEYLRTWRDFKAYLDARASALRNADLRTIGAEQALFSFYTASKDSFSGCHGIDDAKIVTAAGIPLCEGIAHRRREMIQSLILENFIEVLASSGDIDLPVDCEDLRSKVCGNEAEKSALLDDFCDLTIQERAQLGEQIGFLSEAVYREKESYYGSVRFNRRSDRVYVILIAWNEDPGELSLKAMDITVAACVYFGKSSGIAIVMNQIDVNIRCTFGRIEQVSPTFEMIQAGEEYFGGTRPRVVSRAR